jgi:hypothetical protein
MVHTAIADVGETIISLLRDEMAAMVDGDSIVLISPGEIGGTDAVRLSLFLYEVNENPHLKNREKEPLDPVNEPDRFRYPGLYLDLSYLLTAYPSPSIQDRTDRTIEEHKILGRAMQVLHDHAIITGPSLKGNLGGSDLALRVTMARLSMDDLTRIWTTFPEKPFRPSVCYTVTPVKVESERIESARRVRTKELEFRYIVPGEGKGSHGAG